MLQHFLREILLPQSIPFNWRCILKFAKKIQYLYSRQLWTEEKIKNERITTIFPTRH